jgi:polyisoprenyl-teichoic acid--peptidoglycan teichoic acid transferase
MQHGRSHSDRLGAVSPVLGTPPPLCASGSESPEPRHPAYVVVAVSTALLFAATVLAAIYGHRVYADVTGVVGLAGDLRRLPHWSRAVIPGVAVLLLSSATWCAASGRRRGVQVLVLALVVAALATPGFVLGYVDRSVSGMGSGGTAEQRATVAKTRTALEHPLPGLPLNILLLGTDDDHNSDSQILVRLDPQAKTISMLSLPRDLYVDVPGVGYAKLNAAYMRGGVQLAVETFSQVTGLPIDHFIRVDFSGFWHVVGALHGVYLPIDHRYRNSEGTGFQPVDLQPGYQLVKAKQALGFVRFRHDQDGDFTRMVRQQLFLRALQQQATRWSGSWTKVVSMVRTIGRLTTTDLDSLDQLLPVANMALTLDTSRIYQVHVEGTPQTIGGLDYVVASRGEIATAVYRILHPQAPSGVSAGASASSSGGATGSAVSPALATSSPAPLPSAALARHSGYGWSAWRALARTTSLALEAPTAWAPGLAYDTAGVPFRAYAVETPNGRHVKAGIAVGTVVGGSWNATEYWGVQAIAWKDPPAIADPGETRTVGGRTYLLFYHESSLHMVAWRENGNTYWIVNTLDDVLSNQLMMKLAKSCAPVSP